MLTPADVAVLGAFLRIEANGDGWHNKQELTDLSGYSLGTVHSAIVFLNEQNCLDHPFNNHYRINERGKLALALAQGQAARKRYREPRV